MRNRSGIRTEIGLYPSHLCHPWLKRFFDLVAAELRWGSIAVFRIKPAHPGLLGTLHRRLQERAPGLGFNHNPPAMSVFWLNSRHYQSTRIVAAICRSGTCRYFPRCAFHAKTADSVARADVWAYRVRRQSTQQAVGRAGSGRDELGPLISACRAMHTLHAK